ncbi:MAG: DUF3443 family protein [Rhodoferax sp.]
MSARRPSCWGLALVLVCSLAACGDGTGTSPAPATPGAASSTPPAFAAAGDANAVPIYVDGGLSAQSHAIPNAIYTDIEICAPGSGRNCAVIPHVLVDTGSVGLRLLASTINAANATLLGALPQASGAAGSVVGECLPFVSGVTWGGVRSADLHWGGSNYSGEVAPNIPFQVIGDTDARVVSPPSGCTHQGTPLQTARALGGNGIVGIGLFAQDCGIYCAQNVAPIYFQCTGPGACNAVAMPVAQQIPNPVAAMPSDNNGSLITLPGGAAPQASGLLVLGIGTRLNNALPASSAILGTDVNGYFTASFNGNTLARSFFDSGSSANFMPTTGTVSLPPCSFGTLAGTGYLCPTSALTLVSSNSGSSSTSATASVLIVNANSAVTSDPGDNVIPGLAAGDNLIGQSLDLGASFFFGRTIATLIENQSAPGFPVSGPAVGYAP